MKQHQKSLDFYPEISYTTYVTNVEEKSISYRNATESCPARLKGRCKVGRGKNTSEFETYNQNKEGRPTGCQFGWHRGSKSIFRPKDRLYSKESAGTEDFLFVRKKKERGSHEKNKLLRFSS